MYRMRFKLLHPRDDRVDVDLELGAEAVLVVTVTIEALIYMAVERSRERLQG